MWSATGSERGRRIFGEGMGWFWTGGGECVVFRTMAYQLNGTIKHIYDIQTFPSGFSKREFVVTTDDKFPQEVKLECLKEKSAILDNVKEGERVTVHFDLNGREYNGKYFVNLTAWKLDAGAAGAAPAGGNDSDPEDTTDYSKGEEDIPF